ncbi:ribonuclease P 40kDa subunit-domain-containing protein [Zalerion maritima]|uniref:Ribonuclease P 40kDa subunit-domain-containing protein n=1 Tax=Zalerion maritima TaxID=339359 RepID=A0AAD5RSX0_9PEZI|nr:ribonuclease P 40kDa subunit-domain-containing protein [Zalerion maritima]
MFPFPAPSSLSPAKCHATYGTIGHLDSNQLPKKKGKPWATLQSSSHRFLQKVDLIFPEKLKDTINDAISKLETPVYHRVFMSLENILEKGIDGFFWTYVKSGKVMMLSEGSSETGNVLQIYRGQLTMWLEKEAYERAGIIGKPHGVKGSRGLKPRWIVEVDLMTPSMVHGKKGFDRLMYAARNVFNNSMPWILCSISSASTPDPDPLSKFQPYRRIINPVETEGVDLSIPPLEPTPDMIADRDEFDNFATETYEWLSLIRLQSPRVEAGDEVDPYLSLYRTPGDDGPMESTQVFKISWTGLVSSEWAQKTLTAIFLAAPSKSWFSFSAGSISKGRSRDTSEVTVLRPSNSPGEYVLWDIKGPEAE